MSDASWPRTNATNPEIVRWVIWFAILNIVDGLQTMAIVGQHGVSSELNPWLKWWIAHYSFAGLWVVKLTIMAAVLSLFGTSSQRILRGVSLGLAAIVAMNFITMLSRF